MELHLRAHSGTHTVSYKWSLEDHLVSMHSLLLFCQYHSRNKPLEQFVYLQLTEGPLEEVSVSVTANRTDLCKEIGPPTK